MCPILSLLLPSDSYIIFCIILDLVEHMEKALVMEQAPPIEPMITEEAADDDSNGGDSTSVIEEDMVRTDSL